MHPPCHIHHKNKHFGKLVSAQQVDIICCLVPSIFFFICLVLALKDDGETTASKLMKTHKDRVIRELIFFPTLAFSLLMLFSLPYVLFSHDCL